MKNYNEISNTIVQTFEKRLYSLPLKQQAHWSLRRFRVTGDDSYTSAVFQDFQLRTLRMWPVLMHLDELIFLAQYDKELISRFKPTTERKAKRLETYKATPLLRTYTLVLDYLFFAKSYSMHKLPKLEDKFSLIFDQMRHVDWEGFYLGSDYISSHPSAFANSVNYLKFLKIADLVKPAHDRYVNVWMQKTPDRDNEYQLKIYGMTHMIIAQSLYYQRKVELENVAWILSYLKKDFKNIVFRTTPDIITEVGLCFLLTGQNDDIVSQARAEIAKAFDPSLGYIPREKDKNNIQAAEHRNILASILFSGIKELHRGPNLAKLVEENKRTFYVASNLERYGAAEDLED